MTRSEKKKKEPQATQTGKRMSWIQYYDDASEIEYEIEFFSTPNNWGVNIMGVGQKISFHIDDLDWFLESLTAIKALSDEEKIHCT